MSNNLQIQTGRYFNKLCKMLMRWAMAAVLFVLLTICIFAQESQMQNNIELPLDSAANMFYTGGSKALSELIYFNVKYPIEARENCRTGKLMTEIQINEFGKLERIEFLNKVPLGFGLEEEAIRILVFSAAGWRTGIPEFITRIDFVFKLGNKDNIRGDINVIAYGADSLEDSCSEEREILEQKMHKFESKAKYVQAREICEELLRRYPQESWLVERYTYYLEQNLD